MPVVSPTSSRLTVSVDTDGGDPNYPELPDPSEQDFFLNDKGDTDLSSSAVANSIVLSAKVLRTSEHRKLVGQYSLLGTLLESVDEGRALDEETRLFLNTNLPTSFFICGLQGSGKSHTLSCLLGA